MLDLWSEEEWLTTAAVPNAAAASTTTGAGITNGGRRAVNDPIIDPQEPEFDIAYVNGDESWCNECYRFGCAACCCNCTCHTGPRCDGFDR